MTNNLRIALMFFALLVGNGFFLVANPGDIISTIIVGISMVGAMFYIYQDIG